MFSWDKYTVSIGLDTIAKCRQGILLELKHLLDDYHGWERSVRYYDILAGDWLEHFTHLTYAAMQSSGRVLSTAGQIKPIPVTSDLIAHEALRVCGSELHDHLDIAIASLFEGSSPASWTFSDESVRIERGGYRPLTPNVFRTFERIQPEVLLVSPYLKCSRAEVATALFKWRKWVAWDSLQYPVRFSVKLDQAWRKRRAVDAGIPNSLLSALRVLLPLHLPSALLEGFALYRKVALAMPVARPKVVYSANALHGHLTFKILVAEWRELGTRLLYHQHGGGYGIDRIHVIEELETRVADQFFTWGWRDSERQSVRPLGPAALRLPSGAKVGFLLNCVDYPKTLIRLHFQPMPGTIQTMHKETCAFLTAFPKRKDLLVRPYPNEYGWGFAAMMREAAPEAAFDDHRVGVLRRYATSRLVIHNYLGTGYLETLALNVPTICFYDPDTYAFRDDALPLIERLECVGVLHRSGKAAAQFFASLGNSPEGWWMKPEVQEARIKFIDQYANFSPDWKTRWEIEFLNAIEQQAEFPG